MVNTKTQSSGIIKFQTKILEVLVSRHMRALVYNMASTDNVTVDAFHLGIQHALEKLGKSNFVFTSLI